MLIVIPTYKRNHCLKWVLQSLIQCKTDNIQESIRVLVVNNYPPAKDEIQSIVSTFSREVRFEWNVLSRDKTLPPIESWYSAITDNALPDEVVLLHGDDDLFYPWSLAVRFEAVTHLNADLLLAKIDSCLYFSKQATKAYHYTAFPNVDSVSANLLDFGQIFSYTPQHLSNHCYRNTDNFRDGLAKAMSWCYAQDWMDFNNRTLYITLYLPYAILLTGGRVAGLNKKCIIRARDAEEIRESKYGVPSWNHGFIHLCALGVLNNDELAPIKELDNIREQYSDQFLKWFLTYFFDKRVGFRKVKDTIKRIGYPVSRLLSIKVLYGFDIIFKDIFKLRGFRLERNCSKNSVPTKMFMKSLASLSRS